MFIKRTYHYHYSKERTEAFALVGGAVDVHLGADDVTEWHEHLSQFSVTELLRQVIDEQIAALRSCSVPTNQQIFTELSHHECNKRLQSL